MKMEDTKESNNSQWVEGMKTALKSFIPYVGEKVVYRYSLERAKRMYNDPKEIQREAMLETIVNRAFVYLLELGTAAGMTIHYLAK